ncbi:MAG TPA: hypothetical protein VKX96_16310 [Chloroflexota bacterium]|jgi:hypothetical protein|nr:hypothetical protein [Chloroflexota bacterium]
MNNQQAKAATLGWLMTCAVWTLTIAPVILGALLALLLGGSSAMLVGMAIGLVIGIASNVFASRTVRAARLTERNRRNS